MDRRYFEDFGAVGNYNEATGAGDDDTAAIQGAIDDLASQGGGTALGNPGKVYKTTSQITVKANVFLDLNYCTIVAKLTSDGDCGILLRSNAGVANGHIKVVVAENTGALQAGGFAPIRVGPLYGDVYPLPARSPDDDVANFVIRNVVLESNKTLGSGSTAGAAGIQIIGNVFNGLIDGVTIPDSPALSAGITMDWGHAGQVQLKDENGVLRQDAEQNPIIGPAILSEDDQMDNNWFNFANGNGFTTHPHNIRVRNVLIGNLYRDYNPSIADSGSQGVRIAACYNIIVENVHIGSTTQSAFTSHAGDLGFEFARGPDAPYAYGGEDSIFGLQGSIFRNCSCANANTGNLISTDSTSDNVARAATNGYTTRYSHGALWPTDIIFEQVHGKRNGEAVPADGVRAFNQDGGEIKDCSASGFSSGLRIAGTRDLRIVGGRYSDNQQRGIRLNDGALRTLIKDINECARNSTSVSPPSSSGYPNVEIESADGTVIDGGVFGTEVFGTEVGAETAWHCIKSASFDQGGKNTSIINQPTILSHGSGGYALVMASGDAWGTLRLFEGAYFGSAVTNRYAGQGAIPTSRTVSNAGASASHEIVRYMVSSTQDLSGLTVNVGDEFIYTDPAASGKRGKVCVVGGVVGSGSTSLKEFGQIDS